MTDVLNLSLPLFGLILLGYGAAHILRIEEKGLAWLNALIVYFAVPALIFRTVARAPFEELANLSFIAATTASTLIIYTAATVSALLIFKQRLQTAAIQGSAASYGNVGYMGLALSVTAFGTPAAVPAALIFCFDSVLQFTLTPLLIAIGVRHDHENVKFAAVAVRIAKSILLHPFIIATLAGIAASAARISLPGAVDNLLDLLVNAAAPAALFALGVTLALRHFAGIGREFPVIVLLKVIVHPLVAYAVVSTVVGLDPVWLYVAILMASLPTAANVFILATQYRLYVEGTSSAILVTTILTALTVPVLLYLAQHGLL
ncbi:hypothetical protein FHS85_003116 [Rhodoligotrophos appendicifer]|uniref:AEC family transporter n=1 Tax=Rhodoligotrophos appendicifer TaxID=987056 RepID=UPI001186C242|nr:AEC family transporter [Rhodoligotrophos appendicifer]